MSRTQINFRNATPPNDIAPRFWDRRFVLYFATCFGSVFVIEIFKSIIYKFYPVYYLTYYDCEIRYERNRNMFIGSRKTLTINLI